jgi:small GTP-binding protein
MGASFPELTIITTIDLLITQHIMDNGESISVRLWDTAGCERYRSLTASSIRQSEAAVLVYDESIPQTLEELITVWLPILIDGCPHLHHLLIIGNKNDKLITVDIHERITKQLELLGDRSKGHRPSFISVSAMKDDTASLQQVFRQFCSRILKHIKELDPGHYEDFLLIRN